MKKWTVAIMALCLCIGLLAGCGEPAEGTNPNGDQGAQSGTNGTQSGDQGGQTGNQATQPGEQTGDQSTKPNDFEDIMDMPVKVKGEAITEAVWKEAVAGQFPNYSYVMKVGKTAETRFFCAGEEWSREKYEDGKLTEKCGEFVIGGKLTTCEYDLEKEKWATTNNGYDTKYPLGGFPFAFSDLSFDEKTGIYSMKTPGIDAYLKPEQLEAGMGDMQFAFMDGKCVYMYFPNQVVDGELIYWTVEFSDYGTTVVTAPTEVEQRPSNNPNSSQHDPQH